MPNSFGHLERGLEAWLQRIAAGLGTRLIRHANVVIVAGLAVTTLLLYRALHIDLHAGFGKSLPGSHAYTQTYTEYAEAFGGANRIVIAVRTRDGQDIISERPLRMLEELTRTLTTTPGLKPSSIRSIFSPTALYIMVTSEGWEGGRIVPEEFRYRPEDIRQIRANLLRSGEIGRLVSGDFHAALLTAEVVDDSPAAYDALRRALEKVRSDVGAQGLDVHIIGFVPFAAEIQEGLQAVYVFFAISVALIFVLLIRFTRSVAVSTVTLLVAASAVVWQVGLFEILGYSLDPLSVLVPFLILSIGVSHAVQMVNAWRSGLATGLTAPESAVFAFNRMFVPGTTALLANAVGFAVIMIIDIPIIHELGIAASLGVGTMIITNKFLLPSLLAKMSWIGAVRDRAPQAEQVPWGRRLIWFTRPKGVATVATVVAAAWGTAIVVRSDLIVGDIDFGAPELRADSQYNLDARAIGQDFHIGLDEFTVVAEGRERGCTWFPMIYSVDRFEREIAVLPGVNSRDSLASQMRLRAVGNGQGHWAFYELPREVQALGATMRGMELGQGYFSHACDAIPIRFFLANHRAETLRTVSEAVGRQATAVDGDVVKIRGALGSAGLMSAVNDEVLLAQDEMLIILYVAVALLCWITFFSIRAVICIVLPLIVVSQVAEAIMVWLGIGLKVSTLPVVALGVGVGVDYGIYFFSRFRAHYDGTSLSDAFQTALNDVGPAIAFTGLAMSAGVVLWIWSPLQLQADMGLLLAYMFIVNMIGALVVLPALARVLFRDRLAVVPSPTPAV